MVSGFCLAPPVAPLAFRAAELYRGGRVLSDLLITPYLLRVVPYAQREKFLRSVNLPRRSSPTLWHVARVAPSTRRLT